MAIISFLNHLDHEKVFLYSQLFVFEPFLNPSSKFELVLCNLKIFCLRKLVLQSWDEFWIDFDRKGFNFINAISQIWLFVSWELLHFFVPTVHFLQLFCRKNHRGGCKLGWSESKQWSVQEGYFLKVLSIEEYFIVVQCWWEASESF